MSVRPSASRCRLTSKQFVQKDGNWVLNLPPYFATLFAAYFPHLMKHSRAGFCDSEDGTYECELSADLPAREVERIAQFLNFFSRSICLGLNRHLRSAFSHELDFCLALDFTKPDPAATERTEIGELENQAKYQQNSEAIGELQKELSFAVQSLPPPHVKRPRLLTYIPSAAQQDFCLPALLCRGIVDMVPRTFWDEPDPLVTPALTVAKSSSKDLSVEQKIDQWNRILHANGIELSRAVAKHSVIIIDDLYQSGASMWSLARFLKQQGTTNVVGVACVKSWRDTDNRGFRF